MEGSNSHSPSSMGGHNQRHERVERRCL